MVVFLVPRMVSKTLVIKTREKQLSRIFYLRGLFSSVKDFCFLVVILSAISILVACKPCAVKEVQNQYEFVGCRSYRGNFDSSDVADSHVGSGSVSGCPVRQHGLEHLCLPSNSFCFPSTVSGFENDEIRTALEEVDTSEVQSEGFSSGLKRKNNLSQLAFHDNFRFLGGRNILCSLYQDDSFPEFSSGQSGIRKGPRTSCVNPLFDKETHNLISGGNNESLFSIGDGLSTPHVDIKPSVLDWGHRNMYHPSFAYLTVTNLDADNVLKVYDLSSSDSQFYPCEFSAELLAPGENASICFIFLPTRLGLVSAKLIIETSLGGLLIQARGFSVESPYLINLHGGLEISPGGSWRKSMSLFNSFDDTLHVEEVTAWLSMSSGNTSRSSKSICRVQSKEYSGHCNVLNAKDWLVVERGEGGKPKIGLRPLENWLVGPKKTEMLMELDISGHFEGKIVGALCMQLLRFPNSETDTVVVPLEVELIPEKTASDTGLVSLSLEALIPCNTSESAGVALSVRNDAPYSLSVIKVTQEGGSKAGFHIKSLEGVILFPSTTTIVAFINYAQLGTDEVYPSCKITVLVNSTSFSLMEIPCTDVIGFCSGCLLDTSVGNIQGINVDYGNGGERFFSNSMPMLSSSGIKVVNTREADELIPRNWESQASICSVSVLDKNELLFPTVLVGNYSSQWITVKNPSKKPVVLQLILDSGEIIDKCRIPEMLLQPSSSNTLLGNNSIAPTRYGFSIAKDGTTEAFVHPYGVATLGPILFRPSNRCEWRSLALIRNNLSGVEWLSLQAFGGSLSLVLHEEHNPVQSSEFKPNLPSQLNFSSPETSQCTGGKTSYCSQSLTKEVYAKNMGDLPLEVVRIKVSGVECELDGFVIHNCAGFSLQPGEYAKLHISYRTDFTAATVQRDLELVLAAGILVVPMKAIIPMCLIDFCRRSIFWMRVRKVIIVLLFVASLMYFIVSLLFPCMTTASEPQDVGMGKNSFSSMISKFSSLHVRFNWKSGEPPFPEMNRIVKSISQEEALLLEYCDDLSLDKGNVNSSSEILSPSSVLNLDTKDKPESHDLRVTVGKEKGRRRRKKKGSGLGILLSEPTSTQSGNSTPSSPLSSTGACTAPKKPCQNPVLEARNPFSCVPIEQSNRSKFTKISSMVNTIVDTDALKSKCDNFLGLSTREKPCLTRKVASKASNVPSAAFPSGCDESLAPWAYCSLSVSNSPIAPLARAPGASLQSRPKSGCEETMGGEQNYTYDIWGDHLFGLPLAYQSRKVSSKPSPSSVENDSDSFFVRGPQTLVRNTLLESVISDLKGNE